MKKAVYYVFFALTLVSLSFSCKKEDTGNGSNSSWKVKFEFDSNLTGEAYAKYTNPEQRPTLLKTHKINGKRWSEEVTYPGSVSSVSCRIYGDAGFPGGIPYFKSI